MFQNIAHGVYIEATLKSEDLVVEVDEPDEWVLVHGIYVGQLRDAQEESGRVFGDWDEQVTSMINLLLCHHGHFLLRLDLLRQNLQPFVTIKSTIYIVR